MNYIIRDLGEVLSDINEDRDSTASEKIDMRLKLAIAERLEALVEKLGNIEAGLFNIAWALGYRGMI